MANRIDAGETGQRGNAGRSPASRMVRYLLVGLLGVAVLGIAAASFGLPAYRHWRQERFIVGRYPVHVTAKPGYCSGGVYVDSWPGATPPTDAQGAWRASDGTARPLTGWWAPMKDSDATSWNDKAGVFTLYNSGAGNGSPYGWAYATFTRDDGSTISLSQEFVDCG